MIHVDLLLGRGLPAVVQAAVVQAVGPFERGAWTVAGGRDCIPLQLPDGVWIGVPVVGLEAIELGTQEGTVALRLPSAVAWLVRQRIPVRQILPGDSGRKVVLLDIAHGAEVWLDVLGLGLRWATEGHVPSIV